MFLDTLKCHLFSPKINNRNKKVLFNAIDAFAIDMLEKKIALQITSSFTP